VLASSSARAALALTFLVLPATGAANDAAASFAAGGLVLRSEPRVAIQREQLFISEREIRVAYDFVNESDEDVVTEVAFPVPPYAFQEDEESFGVHAFETFKAWADDRELAVDVEARALVGRADVTALLEKHGIDVASFGRADRRLARKGELGVHSQVRALPAAERQALLAAGAVDEDGAPAWTVRLTYHWLQRFPARAQTRIRHAYRPVAGIEQALQRTHLDEACADRGLRRTLERAVGVHLAAVPTWVDYVLTTAKTWKGPIRELELVVERPEHALLSLCWDGKFEKIGPATFRSRVLDFVPRRELRVFFFVRPAAQAP
jgi:hypothetical protein